MLGVELGMIDGMTAAKIAISLPSELVERARAAVRRKAAPSVSAYVAAALREKELHDELGLLLDDMLAETGGPLTKAEERAADRILGHEQPRARKRR